MTQRDPSRDRPGDEMVRITVAEAAQRLGISEAGVRKRVQRNQIAHEHDDDGRLFVWVSPGETRRAESRDGDKTSRDELVEELRAHNATLRQQLEAERQAHAEARRLLLAAMERIPPALEAAPPPAEPPTGTREYAVTPTPQPGRVEPQAPLEGAQEPSETPVTAADEQQGRGPVPDAGGPREEGSERP
jgi:transposase-like protein